MNEKLEIWQQYITLFQDDLRLEKPKQTYNMEGLTISVDKIKIAKSKKKTYSLDNIPAELSKILDQHCTTTLT